MQQAAVNLPRRISVGNRNVQIQRRLGNGAFGVVYEVFDEATWAVCALKDVLCLNALVRRNAFREAKILNNISHANVIAFMGVDLFSDTQGFLHVLLLTEYCSGGTLNDRLAQPSSDETNLKWISQISAAVAYLHSRGVVHRDLKADNVLLTATEDVKLADFGLAREFMPLEQTGVWQGIHMQSNCMCSLIGPIHWVAPEVITGRYKEKADVFSLGTLFYAILRRDSILIDGKVIYGAFVIIRGVGKVGLGYAMAALRRPIEIQFPSYAQGSYHLQSVALKTLQYNPNDRPSAQQVYDEVISIRQQQYSLQQPQLLPLPVFAPVTAVLPPTTPPVLAATTPWPQFCPQQAQQSVFSVPVLTQLIVV